MNPTELKIAILETRKALLESRARDNMPVVKKLQRKIKKLTGDINK